MSFSQGNPLFTSPLLSPLSKWSLGAESHAVAAPASAAWPTANRVYYIPFYLARAQTLVKMWVWNGTTMAGTNHCDMGVYRADLTKVVSKGSTVQTGTSVIQELDLTDTTLAPGTYYMALVMDTNTDHVFRVQLGGGPQISSCGVAVQDNGSVTLQATATLATVGGASSFLPLFGVSFRTLTA